MWGALKGADLGGLKAALNSVAHELWLSPGLVHACYDDASPRRVKWS